MEYVYSKIYVIVIEVSNYYLNRYKQTLKREIGIKHTDEELELEKEVNELKQIVNNQEIQINRERKTFYEN